MLSEDPRMVLIGKGRPLYIHFPSTGEDKSDGCSLPLTADDLKNYNIDAFLLDALLEKHIDDNILRLHVDELFPGPAQNLAVGYVPYELIKPLADAGIRASREGLDGKVIYYPIDELKDVDLQDCAARIQYLVNEILRRALCSMDRIVISFLHPLHSHLLITTSRDTQKGIITMDDLMVCDLDKTTNEKVIVFRAGNRKVTSGIQALVAYHRENRNDILLHVHLLFPVLLDEDFRDCYFTKNSPRTRDFGLELSSAFKSAHPYVLRRNEGIWCRGLGVEEVMAALVTCQKKALQGLQVMLMPGPA